MKNLRLLSVVLLICAFSSAHLSAEIRRLCKVYYETESGWDGGYTMEVTFVTGSELNRDTRSFNYSAFSNYCLVWFDKGEVAILKIDTFLIRSGEEFQRGDFKNLFLLRSEIECTQVNSAEERNWKIQAKEFIQFIDPSEN